MELDSGAFQKGDLLSSISNEKKTSQNQPRPSALAFSSGCIPLWKSEARLRTTQVELGIPNGSKHSSDLMR
jgi:hypothetical protein